MRIKFEPFVPCNCTLFTLSRGYQYRCELCKLRARRPNRKHQELFDLSETETFSDAWCFYCRRIMCYCIRGEM